MLDRPERVALLECDVDGRTLGLRADLFALAAVYGWEEDSVAAIATLMRACYGKGYIDALREPRLGSLCSDNGYEVPRRRAAKAARKERR